MLTKKQRIEWIDVLKAVGMFAVVWGHCVQGVVNSQDSNPVLASIILKTLYSFHMPLFFIISGLTFNPHTEQSFLHFAKHKAQGLIYPYLTLSVCVFPIWLFERHVGAVQADSVISIFAGTVYSNASVIRGIANAGWFMLSLFVADCLVSMICRMTDDWLRRGELSIAILILGILSTAGGDNALGAPWHLEVACVCQSYVLAGFVLRQRMSWLDNLQRRWGSIPLAVVCTLIASFCAYANGTCDYSNYKYGNILFAIGSALGFSLALIIVMRRITHGGILAYIGRNTVVFLMFHVNILRLVQHYFPIVEHRALFATLAAVLLYALLLLPTAIFTQLFPFIIRWPKSIKRGTR